MMRRLSLLLCVGVVLCLLASSTWAEEDATSHWTISELLASQSLGIDRPAFAEKVLPADLGALDRLQVPVRSAWPEEGTSWVVDGQTSARFEKISRAANGFELGAAEGAAIRWLVFYLEVDRFVEAKATLETAHRARLWMDGKPVLSKKSSDAADVENGPGSASEDLALDPGFHRVWIEALADSEVEAPWTLDLDFSGDEAATMSFTLDPRHRLGLAELLDSETVRWLDLSSDGRVLAVGMRSPQPPTDGSRSWIDFYDVRSGAVLRSLEGQGDLSSFEWDPSEDSRRFAYVSRDDGEADVWVSSLDGDRNVRVLTKESDLGSVTWLPDGSGFVFVRSEKGAKDPEHFKRYRGLTDRWAGHRNHSFLYRVSIESGVVERLTAGEVSTSLQDIHASSDRLLFTRTLEHDDRWPFSTDELYELDLETLEASKICDVDWGLSARYTPDENRLWIVANPTAFDGVGLDLPAGQIANLYEGQAYLFDRKAGQAEAVSRDFDPAIESTQVVGARNRVFAKVTDRSFDSIYSYDLGGGDWKELKTEVESVSRMDVSRDGSTLAYQGTSSSVPSRIYVVSTKGRAKSRLLSIQDQRNVERLELGEVEDFDVTVSTGPIKGRVYYPPDFDASRRYPAIVYYYGGTVPVTRSYGGRYPKELWASHGYVVYVPQPSGAIGFGQEFSARHVNNWGVTVADEIIEASKKFMAAHEYVDPERVGCIGASYGGFMTMLLTTRTDIFAGAVAHAGISALSSYWGEGDWGYSYSAAATALRYPWNQPEFYVQQSPLFAADKVTTPILLLHGGIDNNVPPGESEQFYTALRVLGKEVEFVRIDGERHWILQYDKRKLWAQSIIAWFDRTLKGDAGWWEHLYSAE